MSDGAAKDELFRQALDSFQRHELDRTEAICARILATRPTHAGALGLAGVAALLGQRPAQAAERLARAATLEPPSYNLLSALGSSYIQLHRFPEATEIFTRALALRPDFKPAHLNLASAHKAIGAYDKAITLLAPWVEREGADESLVLELAELATRLGRFNLAIDYHRRASDMAPASLNARRSLAYALKRLGRTAEALDEYRTIAAAHPTDAAAQTDLGVAEAAAGATREAITTLRRGLQLDPKSLVARAALGQLFRDSVPGWHFAMLNDATRNAAYEAAIRQAVKPGSIVLDIGTGSGLLAMMAARAGAAHVYACEMQPLIAEKAREIVHHNGLADRITILAKSSQHIKIGQDMPRRADVLVSEIVDAGLLGEGIVLTLSHALRELVAENAAIIPRAGAIHAMLVESETLHRQDRVSTVAGFDLSGFNEFARYGFRTAQLRDFPHRPLSPAREVFRFDFTQAEFRPEAKTLALSATSDGTCHALVCWFDLALDETQRVSSDPAAPAPQWHWLQTIHLWNRPRQIKAGETMRIAASHDTLHVHFLLDP